MKKKKKKRGDLPKPTQWHHLTETLGGGVDETQCVNWRVNCLVKLLIFISMVKEAGNLLVGRK